MTDGLFANPLHWAILLVIVLIIFGPGKLPSVGNALGKSIKEFKKASQEDAPPTTPQRAASEQLQAPTMSAAMPTSGTSGVACGACGKENPPEGRFCAGCGTSLVKTIEPEAVTVAPPAKLTCAKCGTENHATNQFCMHCGQMIERAASRI